MDVYRGQKAEFFLTNSAGRLRLVGVLAELASSEDGGSALYERAELVNRGQELF